MERDHHRAQMQVPTGMGWSFPDTGTCELEGRPRMSYGGDKMMANLGFSKSLFKVNIWDWKLAAKWAYVFVCTL